MVAIKFECRQETVDVRGERFVVRELTHGERMDMSEIAQKDLSRLPRYTIAAACIEPKFTEDEVGELPGAMVAPLTDAIARLSGLQKKSEPEAA